MLKQSQPDVLFIVLDTLRMDRLSCYGYHRNTTPHIDAFAEESLVFDHAISPAQWTIPAHASLFTGEYPSVHRTTQVYDKLTSSFTTLAEHLTRAGYLTVGFCNNPLLGLLENDLDRGFAAFYNYGGVFPDRPDIADSRPRPVGRMMQRIQRLITSYFMRPLQEAFSTKSFFLQFSMHPWVTPFWQRYANVRGNTRQSLRDVVGYLRTRRAKGPERPLFAFVNLMETHMPFMPPLRFLRRFAPYYQQEREARDFVKLCNREEYRRLVPLLEPLTELQHRAINDWYDAEIAYEDHLLRGLFEYLDEPDVRDHTLVIVMSDHGDGLDHHGFLGHSFVVYGDLVNVPLIIRYPACFPCGQRVAKAVSTRRVFHTVLDIAGALSAEYHTDVAFDAVWGARTAALNLTHVLDGTDAEEEYVFTEAYPLFTVLSLMQKWDPEAIEPFHCRRVRRAAFEDTYKLIMVDAEPDELFNIESDPSELYNLIEQQPVQAAVLAKRLQDLITDDDFVGTPDGQRLKVQLEQDKRLAERLRRLGYIE
ncbi:MAG: sulfatase-like hydrolase/transferase [Anaerolineae bacterium]|nr:sulfatase-like hydrolase/transferase [Anaerolineae bacterium]